MYVLRKTFYIFLLTAISSTGFTRDLKTSYDEVMQVFRNGDYNLAKSKALIFIKNAKAENNYEYLCKTYFLLGYISEYSDDFGMSIIYYLEGSRYGQLSSDPNIKKTVISIHKNLANVLGNYKQYNLAHKFINQAIKIAQEIKEQHQIESLLNNKIHEFIEEERYAEAITLIDSTRSHLELSHQQEIAFNNKEGVAHYHLGNLDEAIKSYNLVISDSSALDLDVYASCSQNIGEIHYEKKEYPKALDIFKKAAKHCKTHNYSRWLFESYQKIGETFYQLNNVDSSLFYFKKAISMVENGDQDASSYEVYKLIGEVYSNEQNYEKAAEYKEKYAVKLEKYISQQSSITEQEQKYNIQLLTDRYYDLLAADEDQKKIERLAKFGIGGITVIFLSILFVILYRQRRTKISLARELSEIDLISEV